MNQHYLPQCYLRNFASDPCSKDPWVWIYNIASKNWKKRGIKNAASRKDYYTFTDKQGQPNVALEKVFGAIESEVAPILNSLSSKPPLSTEQQQILAVFVATQWMRVPTVVSNDQDAIERAHRMLLSNILQSMSIHPEAAELKAKSVGLELDLSQLPVEAFDANNYSIEVPVASVLAPKFQMLKLLVRIVLSKQWILFASAPGTDFVTSDNPVVDHHPDFESGLLGPGIADVDKRVICPLTRNVALIAGGAQLTNPTYAPCENDDVATINQMIAARAHGFLISSSNGFAGQEILGLL